MGTAFKVVLVILAAIAVSVGLMFLTGTISILTAPFRGEVEKNELVEASGSYRIAAYDEFYDLCSSIQSKNDRIKILEEEMKSSTDEPRKKQLQSGITAEKNTKANLVNDYNTKAASEYTAGQMKDSDLPAEIRNDQERIVCNAS